ncbi:MAG TPA: sigma-70 family RNA polymerase sigma factor [Solirubrobacteraceae bacterium]|jgi:RNA polymerase sigma-70 factor (ECF subfamily)|nr:sigma-70 family RNA polymerase sigma factor [Solirubrobacteraceae bacterium]
MTATQIKTLGDHDLVLRTADGDAQAFEALYGRYRGQVFRMAMRVTGRPRAAEEVTQDAFVGLWRNARNYDPDKGTLNTWLMTAARNRGIDWLRRESRHDRACELDDALVERLEANDCTEEEAGRREQSRETRQLVAALPAEQRQVIELSYFAQLTQTEIAKSVGIPLGTVKGRQRLALRRMHRSLDWERSAA